MAITWPTDFWKRANERQQTEKKTYKFQKILMP